MTKKEQKKLRKRLIFIECAVLILMATVIFRRFICTSGWPAGGDTLGWVSRVYLFGPDFQWLSLWRPYSFGFVEEISLLDFFLAGLYHLIGNGILMVKIFFVLCFVGSGLSSFFFAYWFSHSYWGSFSASIIYTLNPWFSSQLTEGHLALILSYSVVPLLFVLIDKALTRGRTKDILWLSLGFTIALTAFHSLALIVYSCFFLLFIVVHVLSFVKSKSTFAIINSVKVLAISGGITLVLSAFFILPILLNVKPTYFGLSYAIEEAYGHAYPDVANAFALNAWESWGYVGIVDVRTELGVLGLVSMVCLLIVFFLAYGTLLFKRDKYSFFFAMSAFICTLMATGPNPPFGQVFVWMWYNVPYFSIFRSAARWVMMSAVSHCFFVSTMVGMVVRYLRQKKRKPNVKNVLVDTKDGNSRFSSILKPLTKIITNRGFYYFGLLLLFLTFISPITSCWFLFNHGLEVYTPSKTTLAPFHWIGNQSGDYKVITVGPSSSDFSTPAMLTDVGWQHEVGFDSSFIHNKPTLQDGGWTDQCRAFVNYLRFTLVRSHLTDDFMKILGPFNYRYVVIPDYAAEATRNFFLGQEDYKVVFEKNRSLVLENECHTSQVFAPSRHVVVIGGLESYPALVEGNLLSLNETALLFAHRHPQLLKSPTLNESEGLIFVNSDLLDLVMLNLNKEPVINAENLASNSKDYEKCWGEFSGWSEVGRLVMGQSGYGYTATTNGSHTLNIPVSIDRKENYDVWIRIGFATYRGVLTVSMNNVSLGEIRPSAPYFANLKWVRVGEVRLNEGDHILSLTNDGTGWNDVDAVAVISPSDLEDARRETVNQVQKYPGRLIYVFTAETAFDYSASPDWSFIRKDRQGYVLRFEGSQNISSTSTVEAFTTLDLSREAKYMIAARLGGGVGKGSLQITIGESGLAIPCPSDSAQFTWLTAGPIHLEPGEQRLSLAASGPVDVDEIVLYSLREEEQTASIDDVFTGFSNRINSCERENSGAYRVRMELEKPTLLVFSESYHSSWRAYVNGKEIEPIPGYSMVNIFPVEETGKLEISIIFAGQSSANLGLWISGISFMTFGGLFLIAYRAPQRVVRLLKQCASTRET